MKHLSDEQLGARLDGELPAKQAEEADRHLAACAECRERLAALTGADAALARALDHDPGPRYFETFADRVQARIAAGTAPARAEAAPSRGGWWARPAALAWAGTAAALVVVAALAWQFVSQPTAGSRANTPTRSIVGADRLEREAAAPAPANEAAPAPAGTADEARESQAGARGVPASPPAGSRETASGGASSPLLQGSDRAASPPAARAPEAPARQRLEELKTLPSGELVPVQRRTLPSGGRTEGFAAAPGSEATKFKKPAAAPLAPTPQAVPSPVVTQEASRAAAGKALAAAPKSAAAPETAQGAAGLSEADAVADLNKDQGEVATFRLCGTVKNAQGRAVPGATVTVVETGRSTTAGADGAFCLDAPAAGATLAVLSLGYQEYRAKVDEPDAAQGWVARLQSVDALGTGQALAGRLKTAPPPEAAQRAFGESAPAPGSTRGGALGALRDAPAIPALPGETPDAKLAREATDAALRTRSAPAWSRAGALWTAAAASARTEAAGEEARYRAAEARTNAWRLARGSANRNAAAEAIDAYLAKAPAGGRRLTAEGWRKELPER